MNLPWGALTCWARICTIWEDILELRHWIWPSFVLSSVARIRGNCWQIWSLECHPNISAFIQYLWRCAPGTIYLIWNVGIGIQTIYILGILYTSEKRTVLCNDILESIEHDLRYIQYPVRLRYCVITPKMHMSARLGANLLDGIVHVLQHIESF